MKTIIINTLGFIILTIGAGYAFYQVPAITVSSENLGENASNDQVARSNATEQATAIVQNKVIPPEERDPNRLWCREHGLYEDECLICHPELADKNTNASDNQVIPPEERDPNRLWCREHGLYEDECFICHPELATQNEAHASNEHEGHEHEGVQFSNATQNEIIPPEERDLNRLWCREHGLYEDECVICHPEIALKKTIDSNIESPQPSSIQGLYCNEHQMPEIECGICQPQLAANLAPGGSMKLRLASMESSLKAGIQTGRPHNGMIQQDQKFISEVEFDQTKVAHISPLANGVIQSVYIDYGDQVNQGQVLFEIASTEVANAKSEYLKSLDQEKLKRMVFEREKELRDKNITALQDYQQAQAEYQVAQTNTMTARQQLVNYGLTDEDIRLVRDKRSTTATVKIRAPFAGTIVEKHAVFGEAVSAGESVVELVDLSKMWLSLSIPESQISTIQLNDEIQAEFETLPGKRFTGKLTWISPRINQNTRMLKARATLDNASGLLREGLFGQATKIEQENHNKLLIPENSLQFVDGKPFVFIKNEDDLFELRHVEPGVRAGESIEIVQGLSPEENLVIAGSFALKSEFLKSRFGAGCADD